MTKMKDADSCGPHIEKVTGKVPLSTLNGYEKNRPDFCEIIFPPARLKLAPRHGHNPTWTC